MKNNHHTEFEKLGVELKKRGPMLSMWRMIMENKKWWLIPVVLMLMVLGLLVFLSGSAAAPFIYTLF